VADHWSIVTIHIKRSEKGIKRSEKGFCRAFCLNIFVIEVLVLSFLRSKKLPKSSTKGQLPGDYIFLKRKSNIISEARKRNPL
jgi:hypothetical protein